MRNVKSDQDSAIERVLRDALSTSATSDRTDRCLDLATLAAWVDRTLSPGEQSMVGAHAADCAYCQALVAAIVKTSPYPVSRSWWRLPSAGWLVPLTAAAAIVVMVLIILPRRASVRSGDRTASAVAKATVPSQQADTTSAQSRQSEQPQQQADASTLSRRDSVSPPARLRETEARGETPISPVRKRNEPAASPQELRGDTATASAPLSTAESARVASRPEAESPRPALQIGADTGALRALAAVAGSRTVIVSSNPASRWQIVPDGAVLHSRDGGSTWQTEQTGATETLTAGASPSPSVCWLVGRRGIVLLSSNSESWQRVAIPLDIDLVSIRATDDKNATVTASDGRVFSTTDGGLNWSRLLR